MFRRQGTNQNSVQQLISLASQYNWRMPGLHRSTNQGSVYIYDDVAVDLLHVFLQAADSTL